jgi:hypothetical protein
VFGGRWDGAYTRSAAAPMLPGRDRADAWHLTSPTPETAVLYTIALVLLILWLLGAVTAFTAGGLLHLLLVAAIVMVLVQFITGRRA